MGESRLAEGPAAAAAGAEMRVRVALAIEICCARRTLRRTVRIAAVVGVVLTGINEGDSLVHGNVTAATGLKMGLNFVVPFVVSNLGVLAGTRREGHHPPRLVKPPTSAP